MKLQAFFLYLKKKTIPQAPDWVSSIADAHSTTDGITLIAELADVLTEHHFGPVAGVHLPPVHFLAIVDDWFIMPVFMAVALSACKQVSVDSSLICNTDTSVIGH